jgi:UDP-glucose 4-epimerase
LAALLVETNGAGEFLMRAFPEERKKIDIGDFYSDFRLIRQELGWEPQVPLGQGLSRTLDFYRRNLPHYV